MLQQTISRSQNIEAENKSISELESIDNSCLDVMENNCENDVDIIKDEIKIFISFSVSRLLIHMNFRYYNYIIKY